MPGEGLAMTFEWIKTKSEFSLPKESDLIHCIPIGVYAQNFNLHWTCAGVHVRNYCIQKQDHIGIDYKCTKVHLRRGILWGREYVASVDIEKGCQVCSVFQLCDDWKMLS